MYLVKTDDVRALNEIADEFDCINDVAHCDLGNANFLALTEMDDRFPGWTKGVPGLVDRDDGLAVFTISAEGLAWFQEIAEELADYGADPEAIRALVSSADPGTTYGIDTY